MEYAGLHGMIILTHDLDFGRILALTHHKQPSVIQCRATDIRPNHIGNQLIDVLHHHRDLLREGALITVEIDRHPVRVLPL